MPHVYLISYDIADDDRRANISDQLSAYGVRVQYSVFEITLPTKADARRLRTRLRTLIDPDEDQIRIYPLAPATVNELVILGNRHLEERADYWII